MPKWELSRVSVCLGVGVCVLLFYAYFYRITCFGILAYFTGSGSQTDIASIFVPRDQKYNEKLGVIYNCFDTSPYRKVNSSRRTHDLRISKVLKQAGEDSTKRKTEFRKIFEEQLWQPVEWRNASAKDFQASGPGSLLMAAQTPLALLNSLIERLKIFLHKPVITMVDIHCGDFFWMRELVGRRSDVHYTGIDIVAPLIERHKTQYKSMKNAQFINMDIVESDLGQSYDIIFSRDMLQHLSNPDAMKVLARFSSSGSKLLVTTNLYNEANVDLTDTAEQGRYRHLNLMLPPINLVPPICSMRDDPWADMKELAVWKLPLRQRDY